MLDLGVGSGRTAYTFAALVRRYVGVDYSPRMIELARQLVGADERVELRLGDARELDDVGGPFDFALFSFNGIDAVGHEGRLRILRGVRGVLKPGGLFLFSSHSLNALPLSRRRRRGRGARRSLLRDAYALLDGIRSPAGSTRPTRPSISVRHAGSVTRRSATTPTASRSRPTTSTRGSSSSSSPRAACGWSAPSTPPAEVDPLRAGRDPWLSYLCAPA